MTQIEIGAFLSLFNRGGYVLDLTTDAFDALTMEAVGEALCSKYQLSKGKSLKAYLMEASDDKAFDLLNALMNYYEQYSLFENETRDSDSLFGDLDSVGLYRKAYLKCKEILDNHRGVSANTARAEIIEDMFSTQYMRQQIRLMIEMQGETVDEIMAAPNWRDIYNEDGTRKDGRSSSLTTERNNDAIATASLWDTNYNDKILNTQQKYDEWNRYVDMNPFRWRMRDERPDLFEHRLHLMVEGTDYSAWGCMFLLRKPDRIQVFCPIGIRWMLPNATA